MYLINRDGNFDVIDRRDKSTIQVQWFMWTLGIPCPWPWELFHDGNDSMFRRSCLDAYGTGSSLPGLIGM